MIREYSLSTVMRTNPIKRYDKLVSSFDLDDVHQFNVGGSTSTKCITSSNLFEEFS